MFISNSPPVRVNLLLLPLQEVVTNQNFFVRLNVVHSGGGLLSSLHVKNFEALHHLVIDAVVQHSSPPSYTLCLLSSYCFLSGVPTPGASRPTAPNAHQPLFPCPPPAPQPRRRTTAPTQGGCGATAARVAFRASVLNQRASQPWRSTAASPRGGSSRVDLNPCSCLSSLGRLAESLAHSLPDRQGPTASFPSGLTSRISDLLRASQQGHPDMVGAPVGRRCRLLRVHGVAGARHLRGLGVSDGGLLLPSSFRPAASCRAPARSILAPGRRPSSGRIPRACHSACPTGADSHPEHHRTAHQASACTALCSPPVPYTGAYYVSQNCPSSSSTTHGSRRSTFSSHHSRHFPNMPSIQPNALHFSSLSPYLKTSSNTLQFLPYPKTPPVVHM